MVNVDVDCTFDRDAIENIVRPLADTKVGAVCGNIAVRNADVISKLISRRFPLEQAPEAIAWAMANPQDALKVVVEA